jgi:hypothetical protein
MAEVIPRIAANRTVELTNDGAAKIAGIDPLAPQAAAFLADAPQHYRAQVRRR